MNLEYILTEDNTMISVKGLAIDYAAYKAIPYYSRCLFMKLSPDHHFQFEATAQRERRNKQEFRFEDAGELNHFLDHCGLIDLKEMVFCGVQKIGAIFYMDHNKDYFTFKRLW